MNYEFEELKNKIKDKFERFIEIGNLEEADLILEEYKAIIKNDIEVYSMEAILMLNYGDIKKAKHILEEGYKLNEYDKDININLSIINNLLNDKENSQKHYLTAKLFNNIDYQYKDINNESKYKNKDASLKNSRIVQGSIEIANQMNVVNKELKNRGFDSKSINYYPSYLNYEDDQVLDLSKFNDVNQIINTTKKIAVELIPKNDIFHFHFGSSLCYDYSDLPLYKELDKKVIMQYWGSDVRMLSKAIKLNPFAVVKEKNEDLIKRRLELISKYVPNCLVDYELAEYVKDYHERVHYTKFAIDLGKYKYIKETNNKKVLIVHAPTSPEIKGTKYILKAIEELKEKYDFDFKLVHGMSHEEAKKVYIQADIILDQVLCGSYGVLSVESMAMGKPVICWISDFMKEKYPKDLPIISANPDNIKEKIENLLNNIDSLKDIGLKGRKYAEKYHDKNLVVDNLLKIYEKI